MSNLLLQLTTSNIHILLFLPLTSTPSPFLLCVKISHRMQQLLPPAPTPTPLTKPPKALSHLPSQDLPLSPPPSLPMVPHPIISSSRKTLSHAAPLIVIQMSATDQDFNSDLPDAEFQSPLPSSPSPPDKPLPTDLLTSHRHRRDFNPIPALTLHSS
jgi:hypothetical protein